MKLREIKEGLPQLRMLVQYKPDLFLHEEPIDREEFKRVIEEANMYLRQVLQEPDFDPEVLIFLYTYLGNAHRIYGQTQKSIRYLQKALEVSRYNEDEHAEIQSLIRLGESYKYAGQYESALECFEQALVMSRSHQLLEYKDFALQYMGKCLMELGEYEQALEKLESALELRKKKGNSELVLATEMAIVMLHILRQQSSQGYENL